MADNPVDLSPGDIGKLSPIEKARLIEELRLSRQLLGRQSESQIRSPHLPPLVVIPPRVLTIVIGKTL